MNKERIKATAYVLLGVAMGIMYAYILMHIDKVLQ